MKLSYLVLALGFAIWAVNARDVKEEIILVSVWIALMIGFHAEEIKEEIRKNK
jgi:hypothetical protein